MFGMIFSPVLKSLYESDSLASYVKYGLHACILNAFRVSKYKKEGSRLQIDSMPGPVKERLDSFGTTSFGNHTIVLEISPNCLLTRISEIEELAKFNKNLFEINVRTEFGINEKVNIRDLLKQQGEIINLIRQHETINQLIFFTFSLSRTNYYLADDLLQLFIDRKPDWKLFFILDENVFDKEYGEDTKSVNSSLYGLMIFLESLARSKKHNLAKRQFYKRQIGLVDKDDTECYCLEEIITPKIRELFSLSGATFTEKIRRMVTPIKEKHPSPAISSEPALSDPTKWRHVLVTGWYGTETNGDKAILAEILYFLRSCSHECKIIVTSLCRRISIQTSIELNCTEYVDLVDLNIAHLSSIIGGVDAVIIGGGPLMESSAMENLALIFNEANKQRKARIIFGCGLGPIHTEKIRLITKRLVELSTAGFLRDEESYEFASQLFPNHKLKWACDPAFGYVNRWRTNNEANIVKADSIKIAGLLRANTKEFRNEFDNRQLENSNDIVASQIAEIVESVCSEKNAKFELLHMNAPWIGGDDRIFNRKIERKFKEAERVNVVREYLTLEEHLQKLCYADVSVAMRYHGHIFSMALGIPFLSIDYTGHRGKVSGLLSEIGYSEYFVKWECLDIVLAQKRFMKIIEERERLSEDLLQKTGALVDRLYCTYKDVFGVAINPY